MLTQHFGLTLLIFFSAFELTSGLDKTTSISSIISDTFKTCHPLPNMSGLRTARLGVGLEMSDPDDRSSYEEQDFSEDKAAGESFLEYS